MPVIVIGADTPAGRAIVHRLAQGGGEVRAFVSAPDEAEAWRSRGIKVAVGDLSDASHVGGAATGAFTAVVVTAAATDGRLLSFGTPADAVVGWLRAADDAGVTRLIVVGEAAHLPLRGRAQVAVVPTAGRTEDEIAAQVAALDEADRL
ncbi:MAG: NAD(P)H-binding protein [Acidimicrobiia bacterium]|nr:NAD(P)H-binding protein [Acidimicrobiia bacterium]